MKIRGFITHKLSESFSDCQDRFRVNRDTKSIALSDGMSQSFLQAKWADLLCKEFTDSEKWEPSDDNALKGIREEWRKQRDEHLLMQEKAGNPYAYLIRNAIRNNNSAGATFLGIRFDTERFEYWVLGDSCLIHIKNRKIESIEYIISSQEGEFNAFPDFLDSHPDKKSKGAIKHGTISLLEGDILLLVSDPFSDFFYEKVKSGETCENYISQIISLESHDDFEKLVSDWRNAGMTNDDSSLIIVEYDNNSDFNISNMDNIDKMLEEEKVKKEGQNTNRDNAESKQTDDHSHRIKTELSDNDIEDEVERIYQRLQGYDNKTVREILINLCHKLEIKLFPKQLDCQKSERKKFHMREKQSLNRQKKNKKRK